MFDAPIGVGLRVEAADKSEPFLTPEKEWETEDIAYPGYVWHEDGRLHMLYTLGKKPVSLSVMMATTGSGRC